MSSYDQEPPFCVQIEPVQGCNLMCDFCGINMIRKKAGNYKFMDRGLADLIGKRLAEESWAARIELAMHGEPTLHPNLAGIVSALRSHLPKNQIMLTCNGAGLKPNTVESLRDLYKAGVNVVALDAYEHSSVWKTLDFRELDFCEVRKYPEDRSASPHKRWPPGSRVFILVQDIEQAKGGTHSTVCNHCGGGAPLNHRADGKKCAKPFREMAIQYNGNVNICCNSFSGRYNCGNIRWMTLDQIWNGRKFMIARKHLYHGMRTFSPCLGCDALSMRVGLLPDKKGKEDMEKPTKEEQEAAKIYGRTPTTKEVKKAVWE